MPRHSKNNTASSVFTYAERNKLDYGTKHQRLGRDSKRGFDCCFLCLDVAIKPMICSKGHIGCRECYLKTILLQKKEIKKQKQKLLEKEKEKVEKLNLEHKKQKEQQQEELEHLYSITGRNEQEPILKPRLAAYWLPSQTPNLIKEENIIVSTVQCFASTPHLLRFKDLKNVEFTYLDNLLVCRSCRRELLAGTVIYTVLVCGEVFCQTCIKNTPNCPDCSLSSKKLQIKGEGTGFSASGTVIATKTNVSFL